MQCPKCGSERVNSRSETVCECMSCYHSFNNPDPVRCKRCGEVEGLYKCECEKLGTCLSAVIDGKLKEFGLNHQTSCRVMESIMECLDLKLGDWIELQDGTMCTVTWKPGKGEQ